MQIKDSELVLRADNSVYHLGLHADDIHQTVITVGDPERVPMVSSYFDSIIKKVNIREFVTHVGMLNGKQITVISTGIGTDNIDIVLNELDICANVNISNRTICSQHTSLNIIRLGTSGTIQNDIEVGDIVLSYGAIGMDGLMHFYQRDITDEEKTLSQWDIKFPIAPYYAAGDKDLINTFSALGKLGITVTNTGFYGPQARKIRLQPADDDFFNSISQYSIHDIPVANLEMETAGIYGLGKLLGHKCLSINAILANRKLGIFSKDPESEVKDMIEKVIHIIRTHL